MAAAANKTTVCLCLCVLSFLASSITCLNQKSPVKDAVDEFKVIDTTPVTEENVETARQLLLYPIDQTENEQLSITSERLNIERSFGYRLPYYGFAYNYTTVNLNGYISFSDFMISHSYPLQFPNPKWPHDNDPALIAPFLADATIPTDGIINPSIQKFMQTVQGVKLINPGVYFRELDLMKTKEGVSDREQVILKRRIIADFADGMIGAETFVPEYAFIVSWVGLTMRSSRSPKITNTFQLVCVTDQKKTYVMFNYHELGWITHHDQTLGKTGEAAYVGFNAGNNTVAFEFLPYSQNSIIRNLVKEGFGNGKEGRYYFNVDEELFIGSCISPESNPEMSEIVRITASPANGNMLGGNVVNITGPCFEKNSIIKCSFYDKLVTGQYVSKNKATCIQPPVSFNGMIQVSASVDNKPFTYKDDYYIESPELASNTIEVDGMEDKKEKPQTLTIKWLSSLLTTRPSTRLTLSLWGYRENGNNPAMTYINSLTEEGSINNDDGIYVISTDAFNNRKDHGKLDLNFGFLQLNITDPITIGLKDSPHIWSKPMPLAWYFWPQWEADTDEDEEDGGYKAEKCQEWYESEQSKNDFAFELPECPCNMDQAMADRGVFVPDQDCNIVDRKCDAFNQAAMHCVRSGQPSMQGAGQQCCYDKFKELIHTNDQYSGGRPTRSFQYGQYPFDKREFVPSLSTWKYDVMPYLFCCKWDQDGDNSEHCRKFVRRRTSQDCVGYRSPAIASVFGDPHFVTFDGVQYTFNGNGEYTLMTINNKYANMDIQGRFDLISKDPFSTLNSRKLPATIITGVAAKTNDSEVVQIYLRPPVARWRYHLSVYVGNTFAFFNTDSLKMQMYKGVTVYVPEAINNQSQINVMFHNGAGLEITEVSGFLSVRAFVPFEFMNGTSGLFGTYSNNTMDEFVKPDKSLASVTNLYDMQGIYDSFGSQWLLSQMSQPGKGASLFSQGKVVSDKKNYRPEFQYPPQLKVMLESNVKAEDVNYLCQDSKECQFDYIVSQSKDLAVSTLVSQSLVINLQQAAKQRQIRCPYMETPLNGKKTSVKYLKGTSLRFVCNDGYRLVGTEKRDCRDDGLWTWGEKAECMSQVQYNLQVSGIVLGILAFLIIIVAIIFCCLMCQRRKSKSEREHRWDGRDIHAEKGGSNGPIKE